MKKTSILRKKYNAPQTNQSHFQTNSRITTEHIQNPNQRLSNHNPTRNTSESIQVKVLRGSICICKEAASRMQILTWSSMGWNAMSNLVQRLCQSTICCTRRHRAQEALAMAINSMRSLGTEGLVGLGWRTVCGSLMASSSHKTSIALTTMVLPCMSLRNIIQHSWKL